MSIIKLAQTCLQEINAVLQGVDETQVARLREGILQAGTVFTCGVGREGLVMRAFAMRLMHLGLSVGVVGDVTTGPIGPGDLLLAAVGPGYLSTVAALTRVAKEAGATVAAITAQPEAEVPSMADLVLHIPAQTMAEGAQARPSIQPMGSVFEQALWILLDALVIQLKEALGETYEHMATRHTNLE